MERWLGMHLMRRTSIFAEAWLFWIGENYAENWIAAAADCDGG
jgi:hypothetical protein